MAVSPSSQSSFLQICLVEGDSAQEARGRHNRQRALLVSIVLQILFVTGLVLFPLFSKGENMATRAVVFPTVPYARPAHHDTQRQPTPRPNRPPCHFCRPNWNPQGVVTLDHTRPANPDTDLGDPGNSIPGVPGGDPRGIPGGDLTRPTRETPRAPAAPTHPIHVGSIEPAMLIHRVEPLYPPLGRQLRREGRVELHAIIATDGTIQSLEVISSDRLFLQSALAAVGEWRYRPTILDGQPVELDTHITLIYSLSH